MFFSASAAALVLMLGGGAFAQTADEAAKKAEEAKKAEQAKKAVTETVVVTGSRIRRNEFSSAAPVQVITSEEARLEGTIDTADVILGSTTAAGAQQINSTWNGFVVEGGSGVNTVSLRGLGATRTLVLINGKRMPPSGTRGQVASVDLNTIPFSMVSRTEFLKDGGSTLYGSEAVGGVINLITKTNQKGGLVGLYASGTQDGGGEVTDIEASYGWNFDRGNFNIGGEYYDRKDLTAGDRDWAQCQEEYVFNPTTGARADLIDPATGNYKCFNQLQGLVRVYSGPNVGEWVPDASSTGPIAGWRKIGTSTGGSASTPTAQILQRPFFSEKNKSQTLYNPVKRTSFYSSGRYQLPFGEDVELKGDLLWNRRESQFTSWRQIFAFSVTTAYLTNPAASYNPFGGYAGPIALFPFHSDQSVDTHRASLSLTGGFGNVANFASDWQWEIYAQTGGSNGDYGQDVLKLAQYQAAIQGCPTGAPAGCVPFNWLDANSVKTGDWNPAQTGYFLTHDIGNTKYTQDAIEASFNGTFAKLSAGDAKFAAGYHWRKESIDDQPGPETQAGNLAGSTGAGRTKGDDQVGEAFLEVDVPLLAKLPMIEKLTVNYSTRYSDYDSYGKSDVHKFNINWQITPQFRLNYSKGTNYRAPALYELYLANQSGFLSQGSVDPCIEWGDSSEQFVRDACSAIGLAPDYLGPYSSATVITQGSKGTLKSESANNMDFGLTWTPSNGLKVRVDYWEVALHDSISRLDAYYIPYLCYRGRTELCSKFTRITDPTSPEFGKITNVTTGYVNIQEQKGRGIDLEAEYRKEFSFGKLGVNLSTSWNLESSEEFLGDTTTYAGAIYFPSFVGDASIRFDRGDWTFFWDMDAVGHASNYSVINEYYSGRQDTLTSIYSKVPVKIKAHTEFSMIHGVSARYEADDWSAQFGIRNLFNEAPPAVSLNQIVGWYSRLGNSIVGGPYDAFGRTFYLNLRKEF